MRERGLANAWHVLDEQMPARQHARHREAQLAILAEDDLVKLDKQCLEKRMGWWGHVPGAVLLLRE
jgi:hypothetical protein